MTGTEPTEQQPPDTRDWDAFIKATAVGITAVLLLFVLVWGIAYFASDYEFATVGPIDDFEAPPPGLNGEHIVASVGCVSCHSTDGSVIVRRSWKGLNGSNRTFDDGTTAVADAEYIKESILDPAAHIVADFTLDMPTTFGDQLSTSEIDAIVAYIQSL